MRINMLMLVGLLAGCGASMAALSNAALNTGLAATVAGASRAQGGCVATCTHGLVCNRETGYCESRRCGRGCGPGQFCDERPGRAATCSDAGLLPGASPAAGPTTSPSPPHTN